LRLCSFFVGLVIKLLANKNVKKDREIKIRGLSWPGLAHLIFSTAKYRYVVGKKGLYNVPLIRCF
jgi:hypothetical protein